MEFPALPTAIQTALGEVPVEMVADLKDEAGDECLGIWNYGERKIKLRPGQPPGHTLADINPREGTHVALRLRGQRVPVGEAGRGYLRRTLERDRGGNASRLS